MTRNRNPLRQLATASLLALLLPLAPVADAQQKTPGTKGKATSRAPAAAKAAPRNQTPPPQAPAAMPAAAPAVTQVPTAEPVMPAAPPVQAQAPVPAQPPGPPPVMLSIDNLVDTVLQYNPSLQRPAARLTSPAPP